ncbi:chemotaxis protein CheA [Nocardioides dubius]|uniref:histidine kinase n=1 Tax=Nocardioides dubius TaxID=317019 RepID=A0ABP4EEC9_9ACTN
MDEDTEIIAEFLVESHENLDQLDRDLVALEQDPTSRELLSSIFRAIHTIKGTSGFLAFGRLEELAHVGENLLARLRDGDLLLTGDLTGVLLRMVDTTRALLALIEETASDADPGTASGTPSGTGTVDVASVVAELRAALTPESAPMSPEGARVVAEGAPMAAESDSPSDPPHAAASPLPPTVLVLPPAEPEALIAPAASAPSAATTAPSATIAAPSGAIAAPSGEEETGKRGVVDATVRVDVDLLDNLVQLVGELVLTRNQILQRSDSGDDIELTRAAQRLDLVASELQESVMQTRMQPIGQVWAKMPRIVRDLANQLGREVTLLTEGHDTELDRSLLEALKGPLTHLVRNALDHGIEPPQQRLAAGKSATGTLSLRARHESGQVVVEIADDGRGLDHAKIAETAVRRGVITSEEASRMDAKELTGLLFRPGFSTAETVTNVSGRGVGMDVVRTNIERIGGTVDITSQPGHGTTCRVRIPLTLAIIPALIVEQGGQRYALPQANLVELVRVDDLAGQVHELAGAPVLRLRGHLLPLVDLGGVLRLGPAHDPEQQTALTVVVVQADDVRFGLCVGDVHDTQEIVVKPIGRQLKPLAVYAGATIMGDGSVALILDVGGIAQTHGLGATPVAEDAAEAVTEDGTALLVLEVGSGRRAALPLAAISRLEEFALSQIEHSGRDEVVQYRDGILPLVRLAPAIGLAETRSEEPLVSVVVHDRGGERVGIVIDRVLDIVEATSQRSEVGRRPGVLGSLVLQDRVTDLVDLDAVIGAAR